MEPHAPATDHGCAVLRARPELCDAVWKGFEQREHESSRGVGRPVGKRHVDKMVELLGDSKHVVGSARMRLQAGVADRDAGAKGLERRHAVDDIRPRADGVAVAGAAAARRAKGIPLGVSKARSSRRPRSCA